MHQWSIDQWSTVVGIQVCPVRGCQLHRVGACISALEVSRRIRRPVPHSKHRSRGSTTASERCRRPRALATATTYRSCANMLMLRNSSLSVGSFRKHGHPLLTATRGGGVCSGRVPLRQSHLARAGISRHQVACGAAGEGGPLDRTIQTGPSRSTRAEEHDPKAQL